MPIDPFSLEFAAMVREAIGEEAPAGDLAPPALPMLPLALPVRGEFLQSRPFRWKIALVFHGAEQETFYGRTAAISTEAAHVVLPGNIFSTERISALIRIPPLHPSQRQNVVEADAIMDPPILSSEHQEFVSSIRFNAFKGNGKATLRSALLARR